MTISDRLSTRRFSPLSHCPVVADSMSIVVTENRRVALACSVTPSPPLTRVLRTLLKQKRQREEKDLGGRSTSRNGRGRESERLEPREERGEGRGDGEESPKADSDVTQFLGRAA